MSDSSATFQAISPADFAHVTIDTTAPVAVDSQLHQSDKQDDTVKTQTLNLYESKDVVANQIHYTYPPGLSTINDSFIIFTDTVHVFAYLKTIFKETFTDESILVDKLNFCITNELSMVHNPVTNCYTISPCNLMRLLDYIAKKKFDLNKINEVYHLFYILNRSMFYTKIGEYTPIVLIEAHAKHSDYSSSVLSSVKPDKQPHNAYPNVPPQSSYGYHGNPSARGRSGGYVNQSSRGGYHGPTKFVPPVNYGNRGGRGGYRGGRGGY